MLNDPKMKHPKYRSDIDGLRAVAVLSVVIYHAFPKAFPGGFIGVDIFFVISGYLISLIVIENVKAESFSLKKFYINRIKRIFPALLFVLALSLIFANALLTPEGFKEVGLQTLMGAGFLSNFLFWYESGYFDRLAILKPLLHLWSLGVEEQFYFFWPIFLIWLFRVNLGLLFFPFLIFLGSFIYNLVLVDHDPTSAFYSPLTRFWELLSGFFLAYLAQNYSGWLNRFSENSDVFSRIYAANLSFFWGESERESAIQKIKDKTLSFISLLGVFLLSIGFWTINSDSVFPGYLAALPVSGAFLLILSSNRAWFNQVFLSNKVLVWVGLISYPLYLWHWPILSYLFVWYDGEPPISYRVSAIILSVLLSWITFVLIEKPIRYGTQGNLKIFVLLSSMFAVGGTGYMIFTQESVNLTRPPNIKWESLAHKVQEQGNTLCASSEIDGYKGVWGCEFGDVNSKQSMLLYGDSHADAISDELKRTFSRRGIRGVRVWVPGCEIVPGTRVKGSSLEYEGCKNSFQSLLKMIRTERLDVIVISRWNFRLFPVPGYIDSLASTNSEGGKEFAESRYYDLFPGFSSDDMVSGKRRALEEFVNDLVGTGQDTYLIYSVPEISWDIAKLNYSYFEEKGEMLNEISIPYLDFVKRNTFVNETFDSLKESENLIRIKPEKIFCNSYIEGRCVAQINTVPFYLDDDHLSDDGARLLIDEIMIKRLARLDEKKSGKL